MGISYSGLLEVLGRLSTALEPFDGVIRLAAYVCGFVLTGLGLFKMRASAQPGAHPSLLSWGLASLAAGVALLAFPSVLDILTQTLFGQSAGSLSDTTAAAGGGALHEAVRFALTVTMLVGYAQILRGLVMLRGGPAVSGRFWTAVTHIVGGCLCANIRPLLQTLGATTGGTLSEVITTIIQ